MRDGLDPEMLWTVLQANGGGPWIGRLLQFVTEGADAASEPGRHVEKVRQMSGQDR